MLAWTQYSLGVLFVDGATRAVGVENASIIMRGTTRAVYNGSGQRAKLTLRKYALEIALKNVSESLAHLEAALAKLEG